MVITAPTPMMTPSMVNAVLILLRLKARTATRKLSQIFIALLPHHLCQDLLGA